MRPLCCLDDPGRPAVLDTSVVINLIATGHAQSILSGLPHKSVIVDTVVDELGRGTSNGRTDINRLSDLVTNAHLAVVPLGTIGSLEFERLVTGGSAETLDDGEAATIGHALEANGIAVIDEAKATRISTERFPGLAVASTVDLLAHAEVERLLGRDVLADAAFRALTGARMSVLPHQMDWIVDLIGMQRASVCASLQRLLRRRQAT
jgi:predicted nucleic acid-binding protein